MFSMSASTKTQLPTTGKQDSSTSFFSAVDTLLPQSPIRTVTFIIHLHTPPRSGLAKGPGRIGYLQINLFTFRRL
jgi:hypothetical protein